MKQVLQKPAVQCAALICLCFLLGSIGWLAWEYHLMTQVPAEMSDLCTMVFGYLLQAAGIGLFAALVRFRPRWADRFFLPVAVLHLLFAVPAVISPYTAGTLVFGFLMNLCCGVLAGYYLFRLAAAADLPRKASVFGTGYGAAILLQWLISLLWKSVYYSEKVLLIILLITAVVLLLARFRAPVTPSSPSTPPTCLKAAQRFISLACRGAGLSFQPD